MSKNRHNAEGKGSNPRDHVRPHRPFWKHAHRDWRVWFVVVLMLAMIGVYVITNDLSHVPGRHAAQPMPEFNAP
jgi:hypothetical protein